MTVSYMIIIIIIWKKSSLSIKDETSNERNSKSRFRRLISPRRSNINGTKILLSCLFLLFFIFLGDQQIESSIRNIRSLGVIPRAKIKTVKMTLVIVIG
jgi:hypothetical protein